MPRVEGRLLADGQFGPLERLGLLQRHAGPVPQAEVEESRRNAPFPTLAEFVLQGRCLRGVCGESIDLKQRVDGGAEVLGGQRRNDRRDFVPLRPLLDQAKKDQKIGTANEGGSGEEVETNELTILAGEDQCPRSPYPHGHALCMRSPTAHRAAGDDAVSDLVELHRRRRERPSK